MSGTEIATIKKDILRNCQTDLWTSLRQFAEKVGFVRIPYWRKAF